MAPMMRHGGVTALMLLGLVLAPVAVWGVDPACPADAASAGHVNVLLQDDGSTVLDSSGPAIPPMTSSASASWGEAAPCDYDGEVVVGGVLSLNPDDTFAAYGVTIRRCMQVCFTPREEAHRLPLSAASTRGPFPATARSAHQRVPVYTSR